MPHSPLIQKGSRGCCYLATRPKFGRVTAFWFACGKTLLRAIQSGHRRFRRACEGDAARSMISMCCASELKRLSAVIQWISRAFSRVEFQAGERQCVKRPAGFTADGRADRISSRFDRICSFFCAYRLEEGSVSSMRIFAESVCQHTQDFAKQADFSPVCGCFPCVRCTHKKINIPATKGVVFVSGEPWVGSPWTPNVNYTRERIYRETEKEQQRGCLYFRCAANCFPSAPMGISRSGFLFLLFLCPKKDFAKDIFLIRLAKSRECLPSFRKKVW